MHEALRFPGSPGVYPFFHVLPSPQLALPRANFAQFLFTEDRNPYGSLHALGSLALRLLAERFFCCFDKIAGDLSE